MKTNILHANYLNRNHTYTWECSFTHYSVSQTQVLDIRTTLMLQLWNSKKEILYIIGVFLHIV